jgi:RNA polymerase sigma-70 factor (sigma-E family)
MRSDEDEDRRQFSEYFAARHDVVRRTAYLMCGDWYWADDLAQAAFIRLAAGWHKVRDRGALDAFVRTCLVRAYLAETRRVWRRRERTFADLPEPAGIGAAAADDDAEVATRRLVFVRALGELPPRQRVTLICRYYQGLDVAETAAALNCSEGTVKSQTARGLAALRRVLGDAVEPEALACAAKGL